MSRRSSGDAGQGGRAKHAESFVSSFLRKRRYVRKPSRSSIRDLVGGIARFIVGLVTKVVPNRGENRKSKIPRGRPPALGLPSELASKTAVGESGTMSSLLSRLPAGMRPPKSAPPVIRETRPLTREEILYRNSMAFMAIVIAAFLFNVLVLGGLQHAVAQQKLGNEFREQLAAATAPTSEGDSDLVLLPDGAPVAYLEIPQLGVREVVVEGTDAASLAMGPGHRRDTVLPGQAGTSVIMGRSAAFGGVFSGLQTLQPGSTFSVITGQGYHVYKVIGLRYAGDPGPAEPAADASRVVLETARGIPYMPTGVARVDAQMVSTSPVYPGTILPVPTDSCPSIKPSNSKTPETSSTRTMNPSVSATPSVSGSSGSTLSRTPAPPTSSSISTPGSTLDAAKSQSAPCPSITPSTPVTSTPTGSPSSSTTPSPTPTLGAQAQGSPTEPVPNPRLAADETSSSNLATTPSPMNTGAVISTPAPTQSGNVPGTKNSTTSTSATASAKAFAPGARYTSANTLPLEHREMATDMTTLWALVFALQFLLVVEIGAIWAYRRFGLRKTWIVSFPMGMLAAVLVSDQLMRLLPNLT